MMELLTQPGAWIAFLTLTALEVALGIDNIIMVTILADSLPEDQRPLARKGGLALAMIIRIALLFAITWVMGLQAEILAVLGQSFSGQDLLMLGGGFFLLAKATHEIHLNIEGGGHEEQAKATATAGLGVVLSQIVALDVVFSLDSVITAVGMADHIEVMIAAVVVSVVIMIAMIRPISRFMKQHPAVKILALSFMLLIGVTLMAEGFGQHFPKGYVYAAFGFSLFVEMLQLKIKGKKQTAESAAA